MSSNKNTFKIVRKLVKIVRKRIIQNQNLNANLSGTTPSTSKIMMTPTP